MSTDRMWQTVSTSSSATERLGERLGRALKDGEVIELVSDLGGGKTTLVRGLARGLGSHDHVSSPSFKISNLYTTLHTPLQGHSLYMQHFDFYRLKDPGLIVYELSDALTDPQAVVVVEWSDVVRHVLPKKRLTIKLTATDKNKRQIVIKYPQSLSYLVEKL